MTADGSIDCANTPAQQETLVSHLLYCETMVALNVLSDGGSFVLKTFTFLECQTMCLIYLLVTCFDEVHCGVCVCVCVCVHMLLAYNLVNRLHILVIHVYGVYTLVVFSMYM